MLAEMMQLPIEIDDRDSGLFGDEAALAKKYGLSVYDAAYLEVACAERFRSPRSIGNSLRPQSLRASRLRSAGLRLKLAKT